MAQFFKTFDYTPGVVEGISELDDAIGFDDGANAVRCAFQDHLFVKYSGDVFLDVSVLGSHGSREFEVRVFKTEYDGLVFYLERGPASYVKLRECLERGIGVARTAAERESQRT